MVNLSGISTHSLIGGERSAVRFVGFRGARLCQFSQGPLRGKKWIVGSSTHGCWIGSYEHKKQRTFWLSLRPNDVVYDIGANVGFYTLLAATVAEQVLRFRTFTQRTCAI